jgi:lysophospholipase L1-like esterase
MLILAACVAAFGLLAAIALVYAMRQGSRPPEGSVGAKLEPPAPGRRRVVCAGDSLTHGVSSFDYVGALRSRLGTEAEVLNAGVNGDFAFNLAERLDPIVASAPTDVVVLIGTNDLCGAENPMIGQRLQRMKRLPEPPTQAFFERQLVRILRELRERTAARVFVVTPPLLGEDLSHPVHSRLCAYAVRIEEIAKDHGAEAIAFHDTMARGLRASGHDPRPGFHPGPVEFLWLMMVPVQRYLLGKTYDQIAQGHGLWGTPDLIHLTETSGALLVDLVEQRLLASAGLIEGRTPGPSITTRSPPPRPTRTPSAPPG